MAFVDTSFWIAEAVTRDTRHAEAALLANRLRDAPAITSNLVVGEVWTLLTRRLGHFHAASWLDQVRNELNVRLERVDGELEAKAWAWLRIHDERPYSFVDATSFALMRKLRITDALAFDGDFAAAGFVELRP
ncbi:MAG: PIN domain-containing protein [Actinomycetota bacterium]|nr:PIN domain-containing protein [Actinomycetota bacterium]